MNDSGQQRAAVPSAIQLRQAAFLPFRPWYLLLWIPIVIVIGFAVWQPIQVLPRISLAPGYQFVDQDGKRLTSDDMRGRFTFYTFMYTRCSEGCPQTVHGLQTIDATIAALDTAGISVGFVAISIDPGYDSPTILKDYTRKLAIGSPMWHFVTGEADQLKQIVGDGFSTYYERRAPNAFTLDPVYVLVDGWGIIRAVYRTPAPDTARIQRDFGLLVKEVSNQSGATRYAYEAAHLFLCYPRS